MSKTNHTGLKSIQRAYPRFNRKHFITCFFVSILGLASVFAVESPAEASGIPMLRNTTTGQIIFHDDFEAYPVPNAPSVLIKPGKTENLIGLWQGGIVFNPFGTLDLGIVNRSRSVSGSVVAHQGKQFFMMSGRAGDPVGQAWQGLGVVANSGDGDTIEATIAFYLTSGSNRALFYLYGGPYQEKLLAAFSLSGINLLHEEYSLASHNGEAFQQTALRFKPDVWNTLTVKHTNGTANWEVSFNGGEAISVAGFPDGAIFNVNAVYFNQTTDSARGTTVYFDSAVPGSSSPKGTR